MSINPVDELRTKVDALKAEVTELSALEEITPEQDARLDEAIVEYETRAAELAKLEDRAAKIAAIQASPTTAKPGTFNVVVKPDTYDYDLRMNDPVAKRDAVMRVLEDHEKRGVIERKSERGITVKFNSPEIFEAVERRAIHGDPGTDPKTNRGHAEHFLATMRPEYIRAFAKKMTGYHQYTPDELRALDEVRAWSNANDSTVIPELFDPQVVLANAGAINPFRQLGTIKTGTADIWEGLYTGGVTASWDAEAAEVSDDDPAFTRPTITAYKGALFVPFSVEFQGDAAAVVADIGMLFADGKDRLESTAFATGSGSGQPKGVITACDANTSAEVTPTTDGAFGVEDLYKLMNTLGPRWRGPATWVTSMNVANRIRAFGTALGHAYTSDLTGAYTFAPLGKALYESSDYPAPTTLTTGAQNLLTFGDHSQFYIYDRVGLAVEFIPHMFSTGSGRPTGQRGLYGWWRTGSDIMPNITGAGANPPILLLQNQ